MCGIAGFISDRPDDGFTSVLTRMAGMISHRGPDDDGVWIDEFAGIALAHRRLSILDTSPAGHQPMTSACRRYVIAFNGEIYNHNKLRLLLAESGGHSDWAGHSDTETLLACVSAWGLEKSLKLLKGMFAIALWDLKESVLYLARDRMGEKPLYYGWQGGSFLFGSELKALKVHPNFRGEVDRGALALFFRHNYIPGPYSIYRNIWKLPAGSYIKLQSPGLEEKESPAPVAFWSLRTVAEQGVGNPFDGDETEALNLLDAKLGNSIQEQMLSDVPLGGLLSGGVDSSTVCALMQSSSMQPINTFTIGFDEQHFNEATHARAIAAHLGTNHTELYVSAHDALELAPQMASMYDEPFADSSQLPTHLVMRMARQHVAVALSGDGADELFGGYNRYTYAPKVWQQVQKMPGPLRELLCALLTAVPAPSLNKLSRLASISQLGDKAHKLGQRLSGVNDIDDFYISLVSEWGDVENLVVGNPVSSSLLDVRSQWPNLNDAVNRMMALDALSYLPDDILVKVDRAAMAVSLESRAPFLDYELVEFAWQLPMDYKIKNGQGKWLLRRLLSRYIPQSLMDRPKMGFSIPLDEWLRGPLRDWGENLLAEDRLQQEGYLNPVPIRAAWLKHQVGSANYGYRLWSVLMFQAWLQEQ